MHEANRSYSQALSLLGMAAAVFLAASPAQSAATTDKPPASPICHGAKCPLKSKHNHRQVQAIKVKIDPPEPNEKTIPPTNSTGGPAVNPGGPH